MIEFKTVVAIITALGGFGVILFAVAKGKPELAGVILAAAIVIACLL